MTWRREARLRPEFASRYPFLVPGEWDAAAVHADRVVANILGSPQSRFISGERALDPEHFEFRGNDAREAGGAGQRREDG